MELVDPRCLKLAESLLDTDTTNTEKAAGIHHSRVESLAIAIQDAVDDWVDDEPT